MSRANPRKRLAVGQFNKLIDLEKLKEPADRGATGEKTKTWGHYATVHANVSSMIGWEKSDIQGPTAGAVQTHLVRIQYSTSLWQKILPSHRVRWMDGAKERILDIKTVNDWNETHTEIRLQCAEVLT